MIDTLLVFINSNSYINLYWQHLDLPIALIVNCSITPLVVANARGAIGAYDIDTIVSIIEFLLIIVCSCRIFTVSKKKKPQVIAMVNWMPAGNEILVRQEREEGRTNAVLDLLIVFLIDYVPSTIVSNCLMHNHLWKLDSRPVTVDI